MKLYSTSSKSALIFCTNGNVFFSVLKSSIFSTSERNNALLCDYHRLVITLNSQYVKLPQKVRPECITQQTNRQTDSVVPTRFSSSRQMSMSSDAQHSQGKQMSSPMATHNSMCVSVLSGDRRSANSLAVNINRS